MEDRKTGVPQRTYDVTIYNDFTGEVWFKGRMTLSAPGELNASALRDPKSESFARLPHAERSAELYAVYTLMSATSGQYTPHLFGNFRAALEPAEGLTLEVDANHPASRVHALSGELR